VTVPSEWPLLLLKDPAHIRLVVKVNLTHTIGDLRNFVSA
jgi:hypothetical protein